MNSIFASMFWVRDLRDMPRLWRCHFFGGAICDCAVRRYSSTMDSSNVFEHLCILTSMSYWRSSCVMEY